MTGFGRAERSVNDKVFLVEVRSLNGKQFDIRLNIPPLLKPYEFDIRNLLNEGLIRGSIECIVSIKQNGASRPVTVNTDLLKAYYLSIAEAARELGIASDNILSTLLKLPDVVSMSTEILNDDEWEGVKQILSEAIKQLNAHRAEEGKSMETDLRERIAAIELQQQSVAELEIARRAKIREGLKKVLEENLGKENYDPNRLEQELIYYIEKIDISEERVRLKNHCDYFLSVLDNNEMSKGKKLSFILQEIGREINTTGSKAYDAEVQKCVILMKDELEKSKEQVLNIL